MINLFFIVHDYSGAKTYANELLGYLATHEGIAVHKLYINDADYNELTKIKEGNIQNIYIPRVKLNGYTLEKYAARCIDLLYPLLNNKKNVIFHLNYSTQVKLGLEARKRFNAQLVYTLHYLPNYFSLFATNEICPEEVTTTGDVLDKEMVIEADKIICVTRFAQDMLNQHFDTPIEKTRLIYNGYSKIESGNSAINNQEIKRKFGFQVDDQIILFVGRLEKAKGVEGLLEAFMKLPDDDWNLKLVLVGGGDYTPFMDLCQNKFGSISFTGKLSKESVEQLYEIADIGVIPSELEQCSYVALEMMKHGLPIIASQAPGLRELFEDEQDALLFPLKKREDGLLGLQVDAEALYEKLSRLIRNRELQKKLGTNAQIKWKKQLTSKHIGESTFLLYKEVVEFVIQEGIKEFCNPNLQ